MKAFTRKQKVIAKSSGRSRTVCSSIGRESKAKGVQSMMRDLGFAV